jgi:hypothetical protein
MILIRYSRTKQNIPVVVKIRDKKIVVHIYKATPTFVGMYYKGPSGWPAHIDKRNWPRCIDPTPYIRAVETPRLLTDEERSQLVSKIQKHLNRTTEFPDDEQSFLRFCKNLIGISISNSELPNIYQLMQKDICKFNL